MADVDTKTVTFVGTLLGSFIAVVSILYATVYCPLNAAVACERSERVACDEKIKTSIEDKLDRILLKQGKQGEQLARLEGVFGLKVPDQKN